MYQRTTIVIPLFRSWRRIPSQSQARNFWDVMRPLEVRNAFRDMERQMENLERNFFRNPLRIITPKLMPIEGQEPNHDTSFRLNIDVQGFKPEEIKISLKERIMKIEAQMDKKVEDGSRLQQSIVREFTLPPNIEPSSLKSLLHEDGILSIEASLNRETQQPKEIPVEHVNSEKVTKSE